MADWQHERIEYRENTVSKVNGYYLHSRYNPVKQASDFVEQTYKLHHAFIVFGIGDGYLIEAFQQKLRPSDALIVVEPRRELLDSPVREYVLNDTTVVISDVKSPEAKQLFSMIAHRYFQRVIFLPSFNYDSIYPEETKELYRLLHDVAVVEHINQNTENTYASEWQKHIIRNLPYVHTGVPLEAVKEKWDFPVVIASAGPSLTKQIPLLKRYRKNFFLLGAGSAVTALFAHGLIPDALITIDGGETNFAHYQDKQLDDLLLFQNLIVTDKITEHHKGSKIFFSSHQEEEVRKRLEKVVGQPIGSLLGGPSVANFALSLACFISTGPVALVGQDLAYTNNVSHAAGHAFSYDVVSDKGKERNMFYVEGWDGSPVLTDYAFYSMKLAFETSVQHYDHPERIVNVTEGGVNIIGIRNEALQTFLTEHCRVPLLVNVVEEVRLLRSEDTYDDSSFLQALQGEFVAVQQLQEKCVLAQTWLEKEKGTTQFKHKTEQRLAEVDQALSVYFQVGMMGHITAPIVNKVMNHFLEKESETSAEAYRRVKAQSFLLYRELATAFAEMKEHLSYVIDRMEKGET